MIIQTIYRHYQPSISEIYYMSNVVLFIVIHQVLPIEEHIVLI